MMPDVIKPAAAVKSAAAVKLADAVRAADVIRPEDIRPVKAGLREKYKILRRAMPRPEKERLDSVIAGRMLSLWQYTRCKTLFTYCAAAIEVDTDSIILRALADGKKVAVPRCVPGTREIEFYYIESLEELSVGSFGIREPLPEPRRAVTNFRQGLCIVPALCYDWHGYRLGYGKGYYDRFLSDFGGYTAGICYHSCLVRRLPHGRYDRPVQLLVTEKIIKPI